MFWAEKPTSGRSPRSVLCRPCRGLEPGWSGCFCSHIPWISSFFPWNWTCMKIWRVCLIFKTLQDYFSQNTRFQKTNYFIWYTHFSLKIRAVYWGYVPFSDTPKFFFWWFRIFDIQDYFWADAFQWLQQDFWDAMKPPTWIVDSFNFIVVDRGPSL